MFRKFFLSLVILLIANSFAYNFAYVFNRKGSLLFPNKYPAGFLTTPPKTRNPFGATGFDKHVFSAIRYVSDTKLSKIREVFAGEIPAVKSFNDKVREIGNIREELRRSQLGASPAR